MTNTIPMDERLLDRVAAERAQNIVDDAIGGEVEASDLDNLVTKTLGVLQENGIYACFLFLLSRTRDKDKKIAQAVQKQLLQLAAVDLPFGWGNPQSEDAKAVLRHVSDKLCAGLDPLLMTKHVFEQTLIYARYGAKAQKNEGR